MHDSSDGKSLTASVEIGQRFALNDSWSLEPQAQLIYCRLDLDDTRLDGLTTVEQDAENAVTGRLGVRVAGDFSAGMGRFQPYGGINLWNSFKGTDQTTFSSGAGATTFGNRIGYTSTEVVAGATLALTKTTSVYGEVGSLFDGGGQTRVKSSVQGAAGVKFVF